MNKQTMIKIWDYTLLILCVGFFFYGLYSWANTPEEPFKLPDCVAGTHRIADGTCLEDGAKLLNDE